MFSLARLCLIVSIVLVQACTIVNRPTDNIINAQSSNPSQTDAAITSLFEQSQSQIILGNLDEATRVLERALRIEPSNPLTWHRIAKIKYLQNNYSQSAVTALRSNIFAGTNNSLKLLNLNLMLSCYNELGDANKAAGVRKQINNIQYQ